MVELKTTIGISLGIMAYYVALQLFSDFMRAGMAYNTPNRTIAKLRTEHKVNIRTFQKNNRLRGFAWFNSIWINENLFKHKKKLMFTFYHEYYHLIKRHKMLKLAFRLMFSLTPILLSFVHWGIWIAIFIVVSNVVFRVERKFEDKANEYAKSKLQ